MKYTIIDNTIRYTVVPPKMRIIYEDNSPRARLDRYLKEMDTMIAGPEGERPASDDIASLVFNHQAKTREQVSRHLATLIQERSDLAQKHLEEITAKISALKERKPFRPDIPSVNCDEELSDLEKAISDLERQKREVEVMVWRDITELRRECLTERQEYKSTSKRMGILMGGEHGVS